MRCDKCGGELYTDRQSVADLAIRGYLGGRIFCLAGCTSVWLMKRMLEVVEVPRVERRGHRDPFTILCRDCQTPVETTGTNTKRCPEHARMHRRMLERERAHHIA